MKSYDLHRSEPNNQDARIFPMMYAPVLARENDKAILKSHSFGQIEAGNQHNQRKFNPQYRDKQIFKEAQNQPDPTH
jgi:hypothetical protein